jgi:hypothetical protein
MDRLINSESTVTHFWNPITLRNSEYGGDMFSETSILTRATGAESQKASRFDAAVKACQKTVFLDDNLFDN